ncbi:MAG: DUF6268 family outer membrane beta-barrel protein [Tannerellaceae bacterium]|jgi:hypothetical protein|nr:DUF6268 family outer membrane beta-barrel protein [Tannerellaceae bacterium]
MRLLSICLLIAGIFFCAEGNAQVSFKSEYIGKSGYWYMPSGDKPSERIGNSEGSAIVWQGNANIPFYLKKNENGHPTAWGVGIGGAYASLNNRNFTDNMVSEIMNLQFGIFHLRPLNDKWSMMASVGMGIYAPFTELSNIRYKNVLGSAGVIFIRHLKPNLDIGGGLAVNSTFGYPMVFPALYLNWSYEGKFKVNVSLSEGMDLSAGYNFNDYFALSLAFEMNGQMALLEKDGKDVMFTHQYLVTGLRSEIKFGQTGLSMPVMAGINAYRPAYYSDRTLKGMFATNNDFYFSVSPYASVGIRYGF